MSFLVAPPLDYDYVKAQILSNPEIQSFQETLCRILYTETSSSTPSAQMSSALVGRNIGKSEKQHTRNSGQGGNSKGTSSEGVVCYYFYKPGHVIRDCKKRQSRNYRFLSAHVASPNEALDQSVQFIVE